MSKSKKLVQFLMQNAISLASVKTCQIFQNNFDNISSFIISLSNPWPRTLIRLKSSFR